MLRSHTPYSEYLISISKCHRFDSRLVFPCVYMSIIEYAKQIFDGYILDILS